jgi:SAM-dependent methyltransferase
MEQNTDYNRNMMNSPENLSKQVIDYLCSSLLVAIPTNVESNFHIRHPRYQALVCMNGKILDIGAGDGGMGQLIHWPIRQEGKALVGCDINSLSNLPIGYCEWISGGYENVSIDCVFGGVLAVHVIEHLKTWRQMLEIAKDVLKEGELIYIEWPDFETISWPKAPEIWESFKSLHPEFSSQLLTTFNFYDDNTHTDLPPRMNEVLDELVDFEIIESGTIKLSEYAMGLVSKGLRENSTANVTMGIWAQFGFAQRVLARKKFE